MYILRRASTRQLVIVAVASLAICSVPVFGTRFLNDTDFYSLVADKILSGHLLYRDALDVKPPLIFLHYALVFRVFGLDNVTALKIVTILWLGASAAIMTPLRRQLSARTAMPAGISLLFLLSSFSGWGEDFLSSNSEILANLFILLGVLALVSDNFSPRASYLLVGGASIGIAFLYRYQSGAPLAAYLTTVFLRPRQFDRMFRRTLLACLGFALPIGAFIAYYAARGALADLRLMLALQLHYGHDADPFHLPTLLGRTVVAICGQWPVLILAVLQASSIVRRRGTASRSEIFMLAFASWSVIGFFAGGRLRSHYFVQVIPAVVLLAAERLDPANRDTHLASRTKQSWITAHAVTIQLALAAAFTLLNGVYYWTRNDVPPGRDLVSFIEDHSRSSDEVLLWKWRPDILFATHRVFATRLLVNSPLIGQLTSIPTGPGQRWVRRAGLPELWPAFLNDLRVTPPQLILDDPPGRSEWSLDNYPQVAPVLAGYHPCVVMDDVCIYVRKG